MVVTKQNIYDLIYDVVIPFEKYILDNEAMAQYIEDDTVKIKHDIGVAKLAIAILQNRETAKQNFIKGAEAHNNLAIARDVMQHYLSIFFNLHKKWCLKNFIVDEKEYDHLAKEFDAIFMNAYKAPEEDEEEEESFLLFESEQIDNAIEHMHHQDNKKISAVEYASFEEIHDEEMHALLEIKEECELLDANYTTLNEAFFSDCIAIANKLAATLFATLEFKDMAYAINQFIEQSENLDIASLSDFQKELSFTLLSQINKDVIAWIDQVFIQKNAIDIHYFDASFFANIAQFYMMLEESTSDSSQEADSDFFF